MTERKYTEFEGRDVIASGIEMPGASGGLNAALAIDGLELHHGDTGAIVIQYEVTKVRFDPVKGTEALQRNHVLGITNASQVDMELVADLLKRQMDRNEEARKAAKEAEGIHELPFDPDAEAEVPGDDFTHGAAMPVNGADDLDEELDPA
jgi:hypothetical protein